MLYTIPLQLPVQLRYVILHGKGSFVIIIEGKLYEILQRSYEKWVPPFKSSVTITMEPIWTYKADTACSLNYDLIFKDNLLKGVYRDGWHQRSFITKKINLVSFEFRFRKINATFLIKQYDGWCFKVSFSNTQPSNVIKNQIFVLW